MLQFYARVVVELELRYVQRPLLASQPSRTSGSDFSIYIYILGECMALLASGSGAIQLRSGHEMYIVINTS